MTRRSKREIERALEKLFGGGAPEQYEFVITETIHETPHPIEKEASVEKTRVWGEEGGEWHSEEIDVDEGRNRGAKE